MLAYNQHNATLTYGGRAYNLDRVHVTYVLRRGGNKVMPTDQITILAHKLFSEEGLAHIRRYGDISDYQATHGQLNPTLGIHIRRLSEML